MNLREQLARRKAKLESDILDLLIDFCDETGHTPSRIFINNVDVSSVDSIGKEKRPQDCKASIEIQ